MATVITTVEPTTVTVGFDDDVTIETTTQSVSIEVEVAGPQGGQGPVPILTSTVATGTTIGTGSKTFTVVANLSLNVGEYVRICDATTPTRYMAGYITSYSGTTLVVNVISGDTAGSGALGAGILSITGPRGATGATGSQGSGYADVTSTTSFTMATGSKVFALTTVLGYHAFVVGQRVRISNTSTIWVEGTVTAASATSMTVNVTLLNGSGTYTSWTFGIAGAPGAAGTNGTNGAAATIAVGTTTTGAAGSSATVTNSGSSSAAVFDFTIPQGATGATGATGSQGVKGDTGATGPKGDTGDTGASGVIGVDSGELTNTGTSTAAQLGLATAGTAGTYTKVTTDTFGRVTSGTTLSASDIPTIETTQVTGTAYTVTRKKIDDYALASSLDTAPRILVNASRNLSNGVVYYSLFTPTENFTMTNFSVYCIVAGTDSGGTTVRRMGLYTASGTNNTTMTLVARTASDATLGNTVSTIYTRALNTTGGYPSTYTLLAGTTYAFAMMAYNTGGTFGIPSFAAIQDQFPQLTPYRILTNSAQTDLPASSTAQSVGATSAVFSRLT